MAPILALVLTLVMSLIPAALFLGLFRGLRKMQSSAVIKRSGDKIDEDVNEVTVEDAVHAVFGDGSVFSKSSHTPKGKSNNVCNVCDTNNPEIAIYCGNCTSKL